MHGHGLISNVRIETVTAGTAVDLANFEGVVFHSAAGGTIQVKHGTAAGSTANVGAAVVVPAGGSVQVHRPLKRFIAVTGGGSCTAIRYGARTLPAPAAGMAFNFVSPE